MYKIFFLFFRHHIILQISSDSCRMSQHCHTPKVKCKQTAYVLEKMLKSAKKKSQIMASLIKTEENLKEQLMIFCHTKCVCCNNNVTLSSGRSIHAENI